MKKMFLLAALLATTLGTAKADIDRAIAPDRLPREAQEFIQTHFPNERVTLAKKERDLWEVRYEVFLGNGAKIEFLSNGRWEEIDCRYREVPVAILPDPMRVQLATHYPDAKVTEINRDRRDYELKLDNGLELTFDLHGNLIGIDD